MTTDFTVAFHIGAHKTATSHLQRSFERQVEPLAEAGIRYYGPKHFRLPGRSIPRLFGLKKGKSSKRSPREQLDLMRKGAHRVVLSEENYIGALNSPRRRIVNARYPHAAKRVADLATAMDAGGLDLFLGVRRPTDYLNSAYCQMLSGGNIVPLDRFQRLSPVENVDWAALVAGLRGVTGINQLTVWRYEDYGDVFDQICSGLVGETHANIVVPIQRRIYVSLSTTAVEQVQALSGREKHAIESAAQAARAEYPVSEAHAPFDGFNAAEHAKSDAIYAEQITAIADMKGVNLLRP